MQWITSHAGRLLTLDEASVQASQERVFRTGFAEWDALAPGGGFACGAVHELLSEAQEAKPWFLAAVLGKRGQGSGNTGTKWQEPADEASQPDSFASVFSLSLCPFVPLP